MFRRIVRTILVTGLLAVLLIAGWVWVQRQRPPAWYQPPVVNDPVVKAKAEDVELAVVEILHRVRAADDRWGMRITEDHINTWLAARMRPWIEHHSSIQWPAELQMVQVKLDESAITIAVGVGTDRASATVYSATIEPEMRDGEMFIQITSASIGRLRLRGEPLAALLSKIGSMNVAGDVEASLPYIRGERPIPIEFSLSDDRRVHVEALSCSPRRIDVICSTSLPQRASSEAPTESDD
ncbi:MAG: hypothetical protein KC983_06730 [Phycisphaerales bacterium]|nr:hypothetical protein [Phycisphaerales bacterium]